MRIVVLVQFVFAKEGYDFAYEWFVLGEHVGDAHKSALDFSSDRSEPVLVFEQIKRSCSFVFGGVLSDQSDEDELFSWI